MAAKAYFVEMSKTLVASGAAIMRLDPTPTSNLAMGFNRALCFALNLKAKGLCTHFAMLHADIQPDPFWLDTLWDEMQATNAHWIAAASPIKDCHGTTSTAIGHQDCWNPWARITMHELHELPETFSIDDLGDQAAQLGYHLLLNTGCMLIDLRPEYWDRVGDRGELAPHFDIRNRIVFVPGDGWQAQTETEDWMLSRILHGFGARLFCTRKVKVKHYGQLPFSSAMPWGDWLQDQAGGRAARQFTGNVAIHEHGYWLENLPDGAIHDPGLEQALVRLCQETDSNIVDLGCGRGWYVNALHRAGVEVIGYDGNPKVKEQGELFFQCDLVEPQSWPQQFDIALCLEVGEHIPLKFADQLLDNVCNAARRQVVLSWAVPGQPGHGHVNCQENTWVEERMEQRGFRRNTVVEAAIKSTIALTYFHNTLMVYDRVEGGAVVINRDAFLRKEPGTVEEVRRRMAEGEPLHHIQDDLDYRENQHRVWNRMFVDHYQMVTFEDLTKQTLVLAGKLPPNLSGVLGVSRKGMLPATILATRLHLPLGDAGSYLTNGFFTPGDRTPLYEVAGPILVVDDGVGTGKTMAEMMQSLRQHRPHEQFLSAAVYVSDTKRPGVDYWARPISIMQPQETEFLNTFSARQWAVDLDGVICKLPEDNCESDDEDYWRRHFETVQPLYLPRLVPVKAIVTSRLEKYRKVTEEWLDRWGVKYGELVMHSATSAVERDRDPTSHGIRKGHWFRNRRDTTLFVESELDQARQIVDISGKLVFCTATHRLMGAIAIVEGD
jgi:uncharacterized HAD superfamily protein/hypoxanthine phosphoribosyltransferase